MSDVTRVLVAFVLASVGLWVLGLVLTRPYVARTSEIIAWHALDGEAPPSDFIFVLFPDVDVTTNDTESPLRRAVLCSYAEWIRGGELEVFVDENTVNVPFERLKPRSESSSEMITSLNREIALWDEDTDWLAVEFALDAVLATVTIRLRGGGTNVFEYEISEEGLQPLSIRSRSEALATFAGLWCLAVVGALQLSAIPATAYWYLRLRARRRDQQQP